MLCDMMSSAGLSEDDFIIKINNRKLLLGLLSDIIGKNDFEDIMRVIDKKSKISDKEFEDELKRTGVDPSSITQIKSILGVKELSNLECRNEMAKEGLEELKKVLGLLKSRKNVKADLSIARGLSYYTGIIFECYDGKEKLRSLAGGGRYDNLISLFGWQDCPATGFAIGFSTLALLLKEKGLIPEPDFSLDYFIAPVNDDVREKAFEIAQLLRSKYRVETDLMRRNLKNQLDYANSLKARKVIFVGPDELKSGEVKIKDMSSGKEEKVKIEEL